MNAVILIPTYNSSKTIVETLDSIKKQKDSLDKIKAVYISDDGSTDDTIKKVKSCWDLEKPPLYIIKHDFNIGEYNNINQAIEKIIPDTDWLFLVHSDNIAKPEWLKMMFTQIENCPDNVASISSSWDNLFENGRIKKGENDFSQEIRIIPGNKNSVKGTLLMGCWWHISFSALRLEVFEKIGYFDSTFKQKSDFDWLLRCLYKGYSIGYIPRTLFFYRQHKASVSSKNFLKNIDIKETLKIINKYIGIISIRDILYLHLRHSVFALKRILRSIIEFNIVRLFYCIETLFFIFYNLLWCFYKKLLISQFKNGYK